jgi:hypothetical protein
MRPASTADEPRAVLHKIENEAVFNSSSDSDDEEWDGADPFSVPNATIINHSLKEPITKFHLNEMTNEIRSLFTELDHMDQFQAA